MKAYYAKQDADKLSQIGDFSKTLMLMRSSADSLKKSTEALGNASLYEKKKFKKKDEETGEETEVERIMTGMPLQKRSNHLLTIIMPWWSRREIQKRRMCCAMRCG